MPPIKTNRRDTPLITRRCGLGGAKNGDVLQAHFTFEYQQKSYLPNERIKEQGLKRKKERMKPQRKIKK